MYEIDYVYKKQRWGAGQFARMKLRVTPKDPGHGVVFENLSTDDHIPSGYVPGVKKGVIYTAGYRDILVELLDGDCHETDSSVLSFELGARVALKELFDREGI
jgi:elongation factor G